MHPYGPYKHVTEIEIGVNVSYPLQMLAVFAIHTIFQRGQLGDGGKGTRAIKSNCCSWVMIYDRLPKYSTTPCVLVARESQYIDMTHGSSGLSHLNRNRNESMITHASSTCGGKVFPALNGLILLQCQV